MKQLQRQLAKAQEDIVEGQLRKKDIENSILKAKTEFANGRREFCDELIHVTKSVFSTQRTIQSTIEEGLRAYSEYLSHEDAAKKEKLLLTNDEYLDQSITEDIVESTASIESKEIVQNDEILRRNAECFILYHRLQDKVKDLEALRARNEELEEKVHRFVSNQIYLLFCLYMYTN